LQINPMRRMARVALPALLGSALVGVAWAQGPMQHEAPVAPSPPHFHHDGGGWGAAPGLRLADRLATLEVYLGITPQQQDAWMLHAMHEHHGMHGHHDDGHEDD
jgi:hypothetical protein